MVLNTCYMAPDEKKVIRLPLKPAAQEGELEILLPDGVSVSSGEKLQGGPPKLHQEENCVRVEYRFAGGGEMLIFPLRTEAKGAEE